MVEDGALLHKISMLHFCYEIINLDGHQNRYTGSKATENMLNWWIFPVGGVASGRVCVCSLRCRLVFLALGANCKLHRW